MSRSFLHLHIKNETSMHLRNAPIFYISGKPISYDVNISFGP